VIVLGSKIVHEWIDGLEYKPCSRCGTKKPLDQYVKSKQNSDGLHIYCNDCRKEAKKAEYERNRDKYKKRANDYYHKNYEAELAKHRQYRAENLESIYVTNKKWRDTHKKEKTAGDRRYRKANSEILKIKRDEARKTDAFKQSRKARDARYNGSEKGQLVRQMQRERYRNRQSGVSSTLTKLQWRLCKDFFFHCCAYCGKSLKNLTQDHFIPLKDGGGYDVNNIIPCCKSCNSSKQSQNFFLWYPKQAFFDEQRKAKILEYLALF